ncbi:MAG: fibronectin type III domain-containing protein, partial [Woeseiaceae bacterium]
ENADGTPLLDLAGYRIYFGTDPNNFSNTVELSNPGLTSYVVENLTADEWYFAATALNSKGIESSLSSPVMRDTR